MKRFLGKIDWYIIKKFLGTYFFSIILILTIAIVFDVNEKIEDFLKPNVTLYEIMFHYYLNFIPYYANMFSPLFVFISVIYFTSKMAAGSEIVAMLSSGMSFKRLLRPYLFGAFVISAITFVLNNYIIPPSNEVRLEFQNKYIRNKKVKYINNIQIEVSDGVFLFMSSFDAERNQGYQLALERYEDRELISRLTAEQFHYEDPHHWKLDDYRIRHFEGGVETDSVGRHLDTLIAISPSDFLISEQDVEVMTTPQLKKHMKRLMERGVGNAKIFEMEVYRRYASVFSAFVLTLIGVVLSAKKKKNGMGINIAIGISLSFIYIFLMTVATTFAISGSMNPMLAAWLPNILFIFVIIGLWREAPR